MYYHDCVGFEGRESCEAGAVIRTNGEEERSYYRVLRTSGILAFSFHQRWAGNNMKLLAGQPYFELRI